MKKNSYWHFIGLVVMLFSMESLSAQQDFNAYLTKYSQAFERKDALAMAKVCDEMIQVSPDSHWGYVLMSYSQLMLKDKEKALKYWLNGVNLSPLDYHALAVGVCNFAVQGQLEEAKRYMHYAYQVNGNPDAPRLLEEDLTLLNKYLALPLSELVSESRRIAPIYRNNAFFFQEMGECFNLWAQGKACSKTQVLIQRMKSWPVPIPYFSNTLQFFEAQGRLEVGDYQNGIPLMKSFIQQSGQDIHLSHFRASGFYYLSVADLSAFNYGESLVNAELGLRAHDQVPLVFPNTYSLYLQDKKVLALDLLERPGEKARDAMSLLTAAEILNNKMFQVKAYNYLVSSLLMTTNPEEYRLMSQFFQKANTLAKGDPALEDIIGGNYASFLYREKKPTEAKQLLISLAEKRLRSGQISDAQLLYNNAGFLANYESQYVESVDLFKRAIAITESYRSRLSPSQQLTMMDAQSSAYGGLILSYERLKDSEGLFLAQEQNRSRFLRERLNPAVKPMTLKQAQALLKPEEALIYYSTGNRPGGIIIHVVTKEQASIHQHYPIDAWLTLKKKYINRFSGRPDALNGVKAGPLEDVVNGSLIRYASKEQAFTSQHFEEAFEITRELLKSYDQDLIPVRNDFLSFWHDYLIQPIISRLQGKISLIISAEEHLNLLPFESFMDRSGSYLIENFEIAYIPSMTVLQEVRKRTYSDDRKPVIAMGGATYQGKSPQVGTVERGLLGFLQVQSDVQKKLNQGSNISMELAKLGFGLQADYLAGTLKEVQMIQAMIPEAKVLIDRDMRESVVKELDRSGELANYRFVHIATHGFAYEAIPELAGLMMTSPPEGDGTEDTFLIAPEIAKMNLQADLAILSACDTGTGKYYRGEGINGLNSALMIAGANGTLLSLWPVSDQGTMVLMTLLYDLVFNQDIPADKALNAVKRHMISGVMGAFYQDPVIWAPFVYAGK
ncbi:CHAT domain-containing protein [Mongoliitalea daihaiensis]|uniref:CHAT domain-containing protein n=1 Tax=Mongoliitalea daihaiensis TaxID=2782006 RepID=UPI001F2741F4|nr:CHAT domain-containing protein [Mongoliitalea daihaiensis]UJP64667.1 CHAT domain-containing protein [Mongoliitalea daihaiensis]